MKRPISHFALVACFLASLVCSQVAFGFEQGSYFVFELVDSDEDKSKTGRLVLKKEAFAQKESVATSKDSLKLEEGEFLIDFSKPAEKSGTSSFEIEAAPDFGADDSTSSQGSSSFGTSSFGTSDSVFGD